MGLEKDHIDGFEFLTTIGLDVECESMQSLPFWVTRSGGGMARGGAWQRRWVKVAGTEV